MPDLDELLGKLTAHNSGVIGCMVLSDGAVRHNLRDQYAVIDAEGVADRAPSILTLMEGIEDAAGSVDHAFIDFENHSVYARRIGEAALVVVNRPMGRDAFRKVQVGVNLFVKPIAKSLAEAPLTGDGLRTETAPAPKPDPKTEEAARPVRFYRGVKY